MKKIAWILPDLYTGGLPRCLETLSMGIASRNEDIEQVVILLKKKEINFRYSGKCIELFEESSTFKGKIYTFFKRLVKLRSIVKREKFDTVISFGLTSNILSILIKKNSKIIITEHNVKSLEANNVHGIKSRILLWVNNNLIRFLYNKADVIVPVSKYIGLDLINNYGIDKKNIYPIYNGVNIDDINKKKTEKLTENEEAIFSKPVIINVGAVSSVKGQWHLIKIMPYIKKRIHDVQLVIIGEGPYFEKLMNLVNKLHLHDCVHFLGVKKNPYKYMYAAKVFALSSISEGFPNVLVEAISVGCPVVSVDCKSGPRELIVDNADIIATVNKVWFSDYGVLTPPFSNDFYDDSLEKDLTAEEKIYADALIEILSDEKVYEHYKEVAWIRSKCFSANMMIEKYLEII